MKLVLKYIAVLAVFTSFAQQKPAFVAKKTPMTKEQMQRWSHLDLVKDSIPGMSVDRVYAELSKTKKPTKVIVAVIDSGVDIDHPDLKNTIWTNPKEIPNNGIDDDKNGYIDDIHGWNFLGDTNDENLEMTRILKNPDDGSATYKKAKEDYEKEYAQLMQAKPQVDIIMKADQNIREYLKKDTYTKTDLNGIFSTDTKVYQSKMIMSSIAEQAGEGFLEEIKAYKEQTYSQLNYNLNKEFDGRKSLGDNPEDMNSKFYGNNRVYATDKEESLHGTHVAGIIAQARNNGIGGDGVATNVEIMSVRAVPNGDEYDKDIALAIRYAVDNGAKIINGSFGKDFSPHKEWVWDAIKYAESKDVLIVHAAGNDAKDVDVEENFPSDTKDKMTEISNNFIQIGALNYEFGTKLVADFSNYGQKNVDVFAPGVKIYATTPNDTYKFEQGTSMASPNAAGVAAIVRSYFPNLKASQVKEILIKSGSTITIDVEVGEEKTKMPFNKTCVSGKIVNAYNAFKMADAMSKGKKPIKKKKKRNAKV
jgi:cell wall-associated protease